MLFLPLYNKLLLSQSMQLTERHIEMEKKYTIDDYALEIRHDILITALSLENLTSKFLSKLLGIEDYKNTRSFGNKSGNLSFNQKIELLIDLDSLAKNDKTKFQTFMEIRNQFMHNIDVKSYTECFELLDGKEKYILRIHPIDDVVKGTIVSKEVKLRLATELLASELMDIMNDLPFKIFKNEIQKVQHEMHGMIQGKFSEANQKMKLILEESISEKIKLKQGLSHEELVSLENKIKNNYESFWKY